MASRAAAKAEAHRVIGEHVFDFYTCQRCQSLVTLPQMMRGLERQGGIAICPCGGLKFQPTNLRWYQRLYPKVWAFAWQRVRELGLAELIERIRHPQADPPMPDGYFKGDA